MTDLRDALSHVLWLGGAPRVGKTTLSRLLAGTYDLKIYNLDWHQVREHRDRPGGVPRSWDALSAEERWLRPSPRELLERDVASWTRGFELVIEDLVALPRDRPIVTDGPGAFPWCVGAVIRDPRQALFLVPTPERWDAVFARRWRDAPAGERFGDGTSEPERARANLRERDRLLGERIAASCQEQGLRCVRVDGSLDLDDAFALVQEHFRPHLPETFNA